MNRRLKELSLLVCLILPLCGISQDLKIVSRTAFLMGSRFEITLVCSKEHAQAYLDQAAAEIKRIEKLISSWNPSSETSLINKNAGIKAVKVSPELYGLIQRSIQISTLTQGAFDLSYAAIDPLWTFDGSMRSLPSKAQLAASISNINYKEIILVIFVTFIFIAYLIIIE